MAVISLTIPDADLARVVEALCDGNSPTNAKAKTKIIELAKSYVKRYEAQKAHDDNMASVRTAQSTQNTAMQTAETQVDAIAIS